MTLTGPGGVTATASTTPVANKITFASAGIEINTSGSYNAGSAAVTAASGTAGNFSDSTVSGVTTLPASMSGSNASYELRDGSGADAGKLELWSTGGSAAKIATTTATVSGGAASATFDNGLEISLSGFTAASAGSAAANGTATADATATTGGVTAATSSSSSVNGTYTLTAGADGEVTLSDGTNTQTLTGIADGAQTLSFGTLGIDLTVDASFVTKAGATAMSAEGGTITVAGAAPLVAPSASNANADTFAVSGFVAASAGSANSLAGATFSVSGATVTAAAVNAPSILVGTSASQATGTLAQRAAVYDSADSITLNLGSLDDIDIKNLSSSVNTGTGAAATGASLTTTAGAKDALARLDLAQEKLNTFVGKLGAAQSRVDYASQNVDSMLQNTQAAESSIRDADMAKEMSAFTKNNILQQAAQSMLSQANQGTQGILQLLRG
jgi:flagellin